MAQDDSGNLTDTSRRFEIYVPSPKARINMGAPNTDTTGPFGYSGVSIQSDVHLFIDANKHTLFQTGQSYCGQVGGSWVQYSNADMVMSSTKNANLSASKKIVIASGAGQGQITALDHGSTPKLVGYNNLELHYRVDRLQTSLFEFFHGRRKRDEYTGKLAAVLKFGGADTTYFDGKGKAAGQEGDAALAGGFSFNAAESLRELYAVASKRQVTKFSDDVTEEGDPITHLDPWVHKKIFGSSKQAKDLKYGHSTYLSRFDPYALKDRSKITHPIAKGLAGFLNVITAMKRFADVCLKYADLITDNFLMKRAQAAMGAIDGLLGAFSATYALVDLTFGPFLPGASMGMWDDFADEKASGIDARVGSVEGFDDAVDEARAKAGGKKAAIQSARGPFDLRGKTTLNLEWGDGDPGSQTATIDLTAGRDATDAVLTVSLPAQALLDLDVTVTIDLLAVDAATSQPFVPAWLEDTRVQEWLLGLVQSAPAAVDVGALSSGVTVSPSWNTVESLLTGTTVQDTTEVFDDPTGANASVTLRAGDLASFSVVHRSESLRISVDGSASTVSLDTSAIDFTASGQPHATIHQLFETSVGSSGTVGALSGGSFDISSGIYGSTSHVVVTGGDPWLLGQVGLEPGAEARGSEALGGLSDSDLEAVTAETLAAHIGAHGNLTVSVSGGTLELSSGYAPTSAKPSKVAASGSIAGVVFDGVDASEVVEEDDVDEDEKGYAGFQAGLSKLKSWNHELQKLPEDTRNLTRPLRNTINTAVTAVSKLESAAESAMEFVGGPMKGLPSSPEAIGLIADEGITLGTRDRIVGVGGKGIVFITDGGSGDEDHDKFIPKMEQFVNLALSWDPIDRKLKEILADKGWITKEKTRLQSLGFRVMSDATVDLFGTHSAQLMALGRGRLEAAGADGKALVGTGVARVGGSHAAEIAGYRKVVISARNKGSDDTTGGRVEVAGQTIAIGGMNLDGDTQDFKDDPLGFGVQPLEVSKLAGAGHLDDDELDALKKELANYAWPETLRKGGDAGHPNTERVVMHSAKETVIQVGTYVVHVTAEGDVPGVQIGTRKANADPTVNQIDDQKPFIFLDQENIGVAHKGDGAGILIGDNSVVVRDEVNGAQVELASGAITVSIKQSSVKLSASGIEVKKGGNTLKLSDSGVQATGQMIKWG